MILQVNLRKVENKQIEKPSIGQYEVNEDTKRMRIRVSTIG